MRLLKRWRRLHTGDEVVMLEMVMIGWFIVT